MTKLASWWVAGRLHVEGIPRGNWEGDVAYYKRVANYYTTMHGEHGRDMSLCHSYKMGDKVESLALDYGLSTTTVRKILRKHDVPIRNARPPIDPSRNQTIYRKVLEGVRKADLATTYGISYSRVHDIFKREESRIKRMMHRPKAYIIPPPLDLTDLAIMSREWTPEMQAAEFEQHRDIDIT
jgi:Mor family transcriptional regulator